MTPKRAGRADRSAAVAVTLATAAVALAAMATILERYGFPSLLVTFESVDLLDHVIFVFRRNGRWGSVARSRDPGLHGRKPVFRSIRDLAWRWNDGRNVRIDVRWGAGDAQRLRASAVELVGSKPDVIVAGGGSAVERLTQATQTIPVVFAAASDPVGGGFVASVARPGGNITGFALYEYGIVAKWLELLKQLAPSIDRVAVLYDPNDPTNRGQLPETASRAPALAVQASIVSVISHGKSR